MDENASIIAEKAYDLSNMYDESPEPGEEGLYGLQLNDGLTDREKDLAPLYASLTRGIMCCTGLPGAGKGVFSNHLAFRDRRFFKGKKVLLDYKPRKVFDLGRKPEDCYFLFNSEYMHQEIGKMAKKAGVDKSISKNDDSKEEETQSVYLARQWAMQNEVLLSNAILIMDEFKKYVPRRNPNTKLGRFIGMIVSVWRHLDLLMIGMCPFLNEIDRFLIEQYMTHHIICSSCSDGENFIAAFYKKKSVNNNGVVNVEGKPVRIKFNGKEVHPEIGVELIDAEMYQKKYLGVKESNIVEYLLSKPDLLANLNMINEYVDEDINILDERLKFMHKIGILQVKTLFNLYNSKNYTNINPKY